MRAYLVYILGDASRGLCSVLGSSSCGAQLRLRLRKVYLEYVGAYVRLLKEVIELPVFIVAKTDPLLTVCQPLKYVAHAFSV